MPTAYHAQVVILKEKRTVNEDNCKVFK